VISIAVVGVARRYGAFADRDEGFIKRFSESRPALSDTHHLLQKSNPL
jgi:hypothetical protein